MADQNITELPIKTNTGVANTDYMLGIDASEGYQILVRDVAKYIVENYNGSTLAGSAQTPKSAIDALNSKITAKVTTSTALDELCSGLGSNVKSLCIFNTTVTNYLTGTSAAAIAYISNIDTNIVDMIVSAIGGQKLWSLRYNYSTGTVSNLTAYAKQSDIDALNSKLLYQGGGNITSSNINSLTTPAIYSRYIEASDITGNASMGSAVGLFIVTNGESATRIGQYIIMPHTGLYACRYHNGTAWSAWRTNAAPNVLRNITANSTTDIFSLINAPTTYGTLLLFMRIDSAADGTFAGIIRHNSAGWQITKFYEGDDAKTPTIDNDGILKLKSSTSATTIHVYAAWMANWS